MGFRRGLAYLAAFAIAVGLPVPAASGAALGAESGELIVRVEAGVSIDSLGVTEILPLGGVDDSTFLVAVDPFRSLSSEIARLSAIDGVVYAEPNYVLTLANVPDDTDYASLWGMQGGFGSNAQGAWAQGVTGSSEVYVAVIDSGIDVSHPDLTANLWVNSSEGADGADTDGNGFIDDIHGYDFLNDDGSVSDANEHPHGTHVAGTIGAVGNNGLGVAGVAWNVKLISAKFIGPDGSGTTANAIRALDYVTQLRTQKGLDIIATNNSYGGPQYSEAMNDAIRRGGDAGILFVAAAGNDSRDLETRNDFPAVYNCHTPDRAWDCVVTVAASTTGGELAGFSNFGVNRVDLAAPGTGILSTVTGGGYDLKSGTSMAAPHVAGALALCVSAFRGVSAREARELLISNVQPVAALVGKVATGGLLDASALVSDCAGLATGFSAAPEAARASAIYTDRIRLDWLDSTSGEYEHEIQIATGPAGCTGTFSHYAFVGPGIDSYPIRGLQEAEFHCLRVRALRDGAASDWATSNVSITWTSNAPFITGKLTLDDGVTPVADAMVQWQPAASTSNSSILTAYTATDGSYVLQVSAGTNGRLAAVSGADWSRVRATPTIPLGLRVGGEITVTQDTLVNLKTPPQHLLKLRLLNRATQQPVVGAAVYGERDSIYRCSTATTYRAWASASNAFCSFYPAGNKHRPPLTDANGEVELAVPSASVYSPSSFGFSLVPTANSPQVTSFTFNPSTPSETVALQTSELVTVSGKVVPAGSSVGVAGVTVQWQPAAIPNNVFAQRVTTGADGSYSISVPKDVSVRFGFLAPDTCSAGCDGRVLPLGHGGVGFRSFSANTELDLTGVATDRVTIRVVQAGSNTAVAGATLRAVPESISYCDKSGAYLPFAGATRDECSLYIAGNRFSPPRTDANGEIKLSLPTAANINRASYSYNVHHPNISGLIVPLSFAPSSGNLKIVEFPADTATLSGQVQRADGTAVGGVSVTYRALNQSNLVSSITTTADAAGNYSITVPAGSAGELTATNSRYHPSFEYALGPFANPPLPVGLRAGGVLTPTTDSTINLRMPEFARVTLTAVDAYSEAPVAGAKLKYSRYTSHGCDVGGYKAFESATSGICSFIPFGSNGEWPVTDAQGKIDLYLPVSAQVRSVPEYVFTVTHPMTNTRVVETRITVPSSAAMTVRSVIPGTPSVPEQPTVIAGDSKVTLNWTEPWNGGAFIDYYQTWYSLNAQGPFQRITSGSCAGNIPADRRSCEVTGLVPGVTYYFAIIAHNVVGASGLSVAVASVPTGAGGTAAGGLPGTTLVDPNFATLNPAAQNALNLGRRSAVIDSSGQVTAPIRRQDEAGRQLDLVSGNKTIELRAGNQMQLREDGVLAIAPQGELQIRAAGFKPSTTVSVLLVPNSFYGIGVSGIFASSITTLSSKVLVLGSAEVNADGEVAIDTELEVAEGGYQLQIIGTDEGGSLLTFALDAEVTGLELDATVGDVDTSFKVWTKRISDTQVKVYARNPIGAGKLQFMVNGDEIAWVRAVDENDPKLRIAQTGPLAGVGYLVRTVSLEAGKNAFEIYLEGERVRRVAYTR